jgi:hypothetical protein
MKNEIAERDLQEYCAAMGRANGWHTCLAIERKYGLAGYPPEIVGIGLRAEADGKNAAQAIDDYIEGAV